MRRHLALIVDPSEHVRLEIRGACEARKLDVVEATDGATGAERLETRPFDLVFVDPRLPAVTAGAWLADDRRVVLVLEGEGAGETSHAWLERGAFDLLAKPLDAARLDRTLLRAQRLVERLAEVRRLREHLRNDPGADGALVGQSAQMQRVQAALRRLSETDRPAGFTGEPGAGKELAARTLHALYAGPDAPFVVMHGGASSEQSWERDWYGADGALARAQSGTLYLEELPALAPELQTRLLRTLALGVEVERPEVARDFRVLWSSTRDAQRAGEEGGLGPDVLAALGNVVVELPPLRARVEDLPVLAQRFVATICEMNQLPPLRLAAETLAQLERYHWPANVLELRHAMEQSVILARDGLIRARDLPDRIRQADQLQRASEVGKGGSTHGFREAKRAVVEVFEQAYLRNLMERHRGNVTAAAQQAGMLRSALQRLLRKYGIKSAEFRRPRPARVAKSADRSRDD